MQDDKLVVYLSLFAHPFPMNVFTMTQKLILKSWKVTSPMPLCA